METIYLFFNHPHKFFNNNLQATVSKLHKRRTKPKNESKIEKKSEIQTQN